ALEAPVRIIGREQEELVAVDLLQELIELRRLRRQVPGLDREAHPVAHDGGGRAVDPGDLLAHPAPHLDAAPEEARQPADARFQQHDAKGGELREDALGYEAEELALESLREAHMLLVEGRGP